MSQISIIVPFNKGKKYLKECFESLTNQSGNFEVILILNGITENITAILEEAKFPITVKEVEEEISVAKARNIGIELSTKDYIYFLDSDDYFYKDSFDNMVNAVKSAKNNHEMISSDIIIGSTLETFKNLERLDESDEDLKEILKNIKKQNSAKITDKAVISKIIKKDTPLEDISVLNILIKKEIITKNNLKFDETLNFYSDNPFILSLLNKSKNYQYCPKTIYVKRERDDPINLPSLNQIESEEKFNDYIKAYKLAINNITTDSSQNSHSQSSQLKLLLDKKMVYDYSKKISKKIEESSSWRKLYFTKYSEIAKEFSNKAISFYKKREINALRNKNFEKMKKYLKLRLTLSRIRTIMFHPSYIKLGIYVAYLNKKPIQNNLIAFESFRGEQYSDSPKYIYEYLYKNHSDKFEFVWIINNKKTKIPGNPKTAKRFSLKYYYYMAISKYWVNNLRHPKILEKRKSQVIIQTWHGTPLKRLGLDIGEVYSATPQIKLNYVSDASKWDYLISPSAFTTEKLRSSFMYTGKVLECGYPRNDILYKKDEKIIEKAKSKLN
ncbi:MAG: CDP-glycerol:glycerophosphate glycerophosphotransferase, partial [Methanobacteriaceae archaeon]